MHALSASYFVFFALLGIFVPYFGLYCRHIGFDAVQIGLLMTALASIKCVSPIIWGGWADQTKRRKELIVTSAWLGALSFIGFFFTKSFWPMLVLTVLHGFFRTPLIPMMEATTWEHVSLRGWEYGKIRLWGSIGFIISSIGVGRLLDFFPMETVLYLMFALLFIQAFLFLRIPRQIPHGAAKRERLQTLLKNPSILLFFLIGFLIQASHGMYYSFFSLRLDDLGLPESAVGINWAVSVTAEIILMQNYQKWFGRSSPRHIIALGAALSVIRWLALAFTSELAVILVIQILHAFTFAANYIASLTYLSARIPKELRTRGQGLYSAATFGLGNVAGAGLGGPIYAHAGGMGLFLAASGVALAAFALAIIQITRPVHAHQRDER